MTNKNQQGFAHILLAGMILVVLAAASGSGYYVWHKNHIKTQTTTTKSSNSSDNSVVVTTYDECIKATGSIQTESYPMVCKTKDGQSFAQPTSQTVPEQIYNSPQYNFSFKYPANWKLGTSLKDYGRGELEGDIYVTASDGTSVHFGPNFGGKGGDCWDDHANARTTRTCFTRKILSVKKLPNSGSQNVWLVEASDTAPLEDGGKTTYFVYLSSEVYDDKGNLVPPSVGSHLGVFLGTYDDMTIKKPFVYLTVFVSGKDDKQNASNAFFSTQEVKEAIPILDSFVVK